LKLKANRYFRTVPAVVVNANLCAWLKIGLSRYRKLFRWSWAGSFKRADTVLSIAAHQPAFGFSLRAVPD
jgi:hypothetical protein